MILAVNLLDEPLKVSTVMRDSKLIQGFRIHLIKVGVIPSGNITCNMKINNVLVLTQDITFTELNELGEYWHGFKAVQFNKPISVKKKSTNENFNFTIEFSSTIHMEDSVYVGIVREYHPTTELNNKPSDYGERPEMDIWKNPFGFELYTLSS